MQAKSDFIHFEDRDSDHPFVEKVWRCQSDRGDTFLSVAANNFEMVVTRLRGKSFLTLRGPETTATALDCPAEGEWLAIRFKVGTFMPDYGGAQTEIVDVCLTNLETNHAMLTSDVLKVFLRSVYNLEVGHECKARCRGCRRQLKAKWRRNIQKSRCVWRSWDAASTRGAGPWERAVTTARW